MNRRPFVAGNWKMHGSRVENAALLDALLGGLTEMQADCAVCPPFVYLSDAARALRGSSMGLGAQDVCAEAQGAFTGEVSAGMLRDVGCTYVVIGHSERRALYGDTDELVARKFAAAQSKGLVPILCVGETLTEREAGRTMEVVARQLDAVTSVTGVAPLASAVLAYEPVWAIGTGRNATPGQAQEVHAFLRGRIGALDAKISGQVRILYGGSVKAANAVELFTQPDVDGGLIGGASLKADEFLAIVAAASRASQRS